MRYTPTVFLIVFFFNEHAPVYPFSSFSHRYELYCVVWDHDGIKQGQETISTSLFHHYSLTTKLFFFDTDTVMTLYPKADQFASV